MTEIAVGGVGEIVGDIVGLEHIAEVHAKVLVDARVTLEPEVPPVEGSGSGGCSPGHSPKRGGQAGPGDPLRAWQPKSMQT